MPPIVITDRHDPGHPWAEAGLQPTAQWYDEPDRAQVRDVLREALGDGDLKGDADGGVIVAGSAATLNVVVEGLHRLGRTTDVPVGFLPAPVEPDDHYATIDDSVAAFSADLGLADSIEALLALDPVQLPLVRNDIGGVLLVEGRIERPKLKPFGLQAYHDDELIADGRILGLTVLPDYSRDDELRAKVTPARRGSIVSTYGRAVQFAGDAVPMHVDGRDMGEVTKRTWYVDDRTHWLLRAGARPGPLPRDDRQPRVVPGHERGLLRWVR